MNSADFDRAAYHAAAARGERVSFHSLMDFVKNGKEYHARAIGELPPKQDTPAMFFGRAAHKLILEGRAAFSDEYLVTDGPINERTNKPFGRDTKAWETWLEQQDPRKVNSIISTQDTAQILLMEKAVHTHPVAGKYLANGEAETPLYFHWCGLPCQSCVDWITPAHEGYQPAIIDLKTTDDLDNFVNQSQKFRYCMQLAFYRRAYMENSVCNNPYCCLIAVERPRENGPAPRCGFWYFSNTDLNAAEDKIIEYLGWLAEAREKDLWKDYYEEPRQMPTRNW